MSAILPYGWYLLIPVGFIALASLCSRLARGNAYRVHRRRMRSIQTLGQAFSDSAHEALAGAELHFYETDGSRTTVHTDAEGRVSPVRLGDKLNRLERL